jgi:hypothetical protein
VDLTTISPNHSNYARWSREDELIACYTSRVHYPRKLPLYDDNLEAGTWHERMVPGEFAVHYSSFLAKDYDGLYCSVLSSLDDAVAHAQQQVRERTALQCLIYDHQGFVGAPLRDIRGTAFKDKKSLSPRFRRWVGAILFLAGLILMIIDWRTDFELMWPGMVGSRIIVPGFALLLMDAIITIYQRRRTRAAGGGAP